MGRWRWKARGGVYQRPSPSQYLASPTTPPQEGVPPVALGQGATTEWAGEVAAAQGILAVAAAARQGHARGAQQIGRLLTAATTARPPPPPRPGDSGEQRAFTSDE